MKNIIIPSLNLGVSGKVTLLKEDREYGKIQHDQTFVVKNDVTNTGLAHFVDLIYNNITNQHVDKSAQADIWTTGVYSSLEKTIGVTDGWPMGPGPGNASESSSLWVTGVTDPMQYDGDGSWSKVTIPENVITTSPANTSINPGTNVVQWRFEDVSTDVYSPLSATFKSGQNSGASTRVEIAKTSVPTSGETAWGTKPATQNWYWVWDLELKDNTDIFPQEGINTIWDLILNRAPYDNSPARAVGTAHMTAGNMAIKVFVADLPGGAENTSAEVTAATSVAEVTGSDGKALIWTWINTTGTGTWDTIVVHNRSQTEAHKGSNTFYDIEYALYPDALSVAKTQASGDTFTYTFTLTFAAS